MLGIVIPVKEEYIPEPGANQSRNAAVDAKIHDMLLIAFVFFFSQEVAYPRGQDDGEGNDKSIAADRKVSYIE
jgi:hypothetical protein